MFELLTLSRPPYQDDGEFYADQPRQAALFALMYAGLPASYDVGIIAQVIKQLKDPLESTFRVHIDEAVFTSTHLLALYQDDLEDAASFAGIKYVTLKKQFRPILWETASAYAGHGLGMCKHWQDDEKCLQEEIEFRKIPILAIHYSDNAFTSSLPEISLAVTTWEPNYRHDEKFTLGSDVMPTYTDPDDYWADVKSTPLYTMTTFPGLRKPQQIIVTGNKVDANFMNFLRASLQDYLGSVPLVLPVSESAVISAKGAAEFMRRGPAPWSTTPGRRLEEQ